MATWETDVQGLPDFLVIGAARAGTTAIYSYLRQCPDIFMPRVKEPNFFAFEGEALACAGPGADDINNSVTSLVAYRDLFATAPHGTLTGEASPLYLFAAKAAARIRHHTPDARLVVVLRNPVEQAFSHFLYATKQRIEPLEDFTEALHREPERLAQNWQPLFGYSSFPRYGEQIERYLALFPRDQILIRLYEDFQTDPAHLMQDIFRHIGVTSGFRPDMTRKPNAGGVPKNRVFQDFLMRSNPVTRAIGLLVPQETRLRIRDRLASLNLKREDDMPAAARAILLDRLADQIRALEPMIERDLSNWLK